MNKITITLLDGSTQTFSLFRKSKTVKDHLISVFETQLANGEIIMMQVS